METPTLVPRCSLLPRVPTTHTSLGALNTLPEDGGSCSGLQLDCSVLLLARAQNPELSWPQLAVPWHLLRLLRYSGRPVAVLKYPLTLPRRGAIDQLTAVASWRRVTADGQGELAMNSALSLVSTWRNCPRRGPPPYNVGSLPGESPCATLYGRRKGQSPPRVRVPGGLAVIRLGSEVAPIEHLYMLPGIYSLLARYLPSQPNLGSHTPELGTACFQFGGYV